MRKILIFVMILLSTAGCGSVVHTVSNAAAAGLNEDTSPPQMDVSTVTPQLESAKISENLSTTQTKEVILPAETKINEATPAALTNATASPVFQIFGKRADGLPENYPDQVVPIYQLKDIMNSEGNSWGCAFEYVTAASYEDAAAYYRGLLRDKEDFEEEELSDETFHCRTPDWDINVNVVVHFGTVTVMIELYAIVEDNPYLE